MSNSVRFAANSLRAIARRLEGGEYDIVDMAQMCPTVLDGRHGRPLPVLIVNMVAWKAIEEHEHAETEANQV